MEGYCGESAFDLIFLVIEKEKGALSLKNLKKILIDCF